VSKTLIGICGFYLIFGLTAILVFNSKPALARQNSTATQLTRSLVVIKGFNMRAMQVHMQLMQSIPHLKWLRDGRTNLFGILFKPENFNPAHKYPVIEDIYAGPQTITVPRSVLDPFYWNFQAVADQGFIVVDIDARGTPGRGKAFQDAFYGQIGQHEIADHANVLQEISKTRPYMDMNRVGVHGHSWGGYFTLRAMLQRPDLYKVGVAGAANADLKDFSRAIEAYMGCTPKGCPKAYELGSNSRIAGHLKGKLMLMHGTADEDVPFGQSIKMIKALEDNGKSYAFVAFPGADHMFFSPYWFKRMIDFFKENLK
jgi:dipeptidyl aminopeptidase/acylaminoacyl peptidase